MSSNPINWFEIYVQDIERACAFYEKVFQIKLDKLENTEIELWGFPSRLDTFGCSGALVKMPGFPSGGNSTIVYFHCGDCAVEAGRVVNPKREDVYWPIRLHCSWI